MMYTQGTRLLESARETLSRANGSPQRGATRGATIRTPLAVTRAPSPVSSRAMCMSIVRISITIEHCRQHRGVRAAPAYSQAVDGACASVAYATAIGIRQPVAIVDEVCAAGRLRSQAGKRDAAQIRTGYRRRVELDLDNTQHRAGVRQLILEGAAPCRSVTAERPHDFSRKNAQTTRAQTETHRKTRLPVSKRTPLGFSVLREPPR